MSNKNPQMPLFENQGEYKTDEPVTCLGQTFANDTERRAHFTDLLRQKLQDPEFRKIEGFPIGEDEDILALSDPPYYTACPNPWLADFVAEWEAQKPEKPADFRYHREPFAADVSEGKKTPIYNAHSYHTKVPHKAIMRYILHYTEPGDIVFDGFCGTGMTGVAAQLCGDRAEVESLGYRVEDDGTILQQEVDEDREKQWVAFSKLGMRQAILNDLSPAATFIAQNYTHRAKVSEFQKNVSKAINTVRQKLGWMYETVNTETGETEELLYCIWSDIFLCPECGGEFDFLSTALNDDDKIEKDFHCPHCNASISKSAVEHSYKTVFDPLLNTTRHVSNQIPVEVCCQKKGTKAKYHRPVNQQDLDVIARVQEIELSWHPVNKMMFKTDVWGDQWRKGYHTDVTHDYHFFLKRPLAIISELRYQFKNYPPGIFLITATMQGLSRMQRYTPGSTFPNMIRSGTLYIGSIHREWNALLWIEGKSRGIIRMYENAKNAKNLSLISTQSATNLDSLPDSSLDYIFLDPPFGDNLAYSELNFLWEGWLKVFTSQVSEAIVSKHQSKELNEYRDLMAGCFRETYRALKPGCWMTVEFSNTKASVWNNIQIALMEAGFIVANVSALDKKQGSFNAITTTTSVRQDLVISAYKPNGGFEERFLNESSSEEGVWDFVRTHLRYLPIIKRQNGAIQIVPERDPRILFDQMIAYYVRKGYPVPISSQEFQLGLSQRFPERDGMYFLPEQVAEYDKKRLAGGQILQAALFVSDESSAIQWLRQLLKEKPQVFSDINPQFMQQLGGWSKNEAQLDLRELLQQNFLSYDGKGPVPEQIHAYLSSNWKDMRNLAKDDPALVAKAKDRWYVPDPNKQADLDKLRERSLLREFETYKASKQKRLKLFRLEVVRAGFQKAWQIADYDTILTVARKIPTNVLQEDPKLLMWYDMSLTRTGQTE